MNKFEETETKFLFNILKENKVYYISKLVSAKN